MMLVEVDSLDKNCTVILNLEKVIEIAPLVGGGCAIYVEGDDSRHGHKVRNNYSEFKQFIIQKVTPEDIARRFPKPTDAPLGADREFIKNVEDELEIPTIGKPAKTKK